MIINERDQELTFSHPYPLLLQMVLVVLLADPVHAQFRPEPSGDPIRIAGGGDSFFMNPRWAPSGDQIAYTGPAYRGLWISDSDGGSTTQLTDEAGTGFGFSWSEDGTAIVSRVARFDGVRRYNAIKVFETGSDVSHLVVEYTTNRLGLPGWLSNDAQVAVLENDKITIVDVLTRSPKSAGPPTTVLAAAGSGIARLDAASGTLTMVVDEAGEILNLANSSDRQRVAYEIFGGDLFVMDADGTNRINLGRGNRPQWSPDGQWIVYQRSEDDGHEFTKSDLFAARADGEVIVQLTMSDNALEMNPSWSSDGQFIAYDDRGAIYLLPVKQSAGE